MIRQRAVRRNGPGDSGLRHDELSKQKVPAQSNENPKTGVHRRIFYCFAVHWICFFIVIYGVILNHQKLYTSEECDMTWSRRQFLQLNLESTSTLHMTLDPRRTNDNEYPPSYRIFKFIDQRDVRYKSLQSKESLNSSDSNIWCNPQSSNHNVPIVLYVPGHGGSYEQSRSLGAHGVQLSRRDYSGTTHEYQINQKLHRRMMNSDDDVLDIENFFFDVYALDFGEEGGALHGLLVERQASYISETVNNIAAVCNVTQLHVVAHSMGGVSSRLALVQYPEIMKVVRNLVTLGTPHNAPIWNWETTMLNIYHKIYKGSGSLSTSIISISGGLRDEMVPPNACYVDEERVSNNPISVLASNIMGAATIEGKNAAPSLGMDHRAIVWCHNALSEVRSLLFNLIHVNGNTAMLKWSSGFPEKYIESATRVQQSMKGKFGYWESMFMKTSQLYNAELLVKLFASLGAWHYLCFISKNDGSVLSILLPPIAISIFYKQMTFGGIKSNGVLLESTVIIAFVADGIFRGARLLLCRLQKGKLLSRSHLSLLNRTTSIALLVWPMIVLIAYLLFGVKTWLQPEIVVGFTLIVMVLYLAFLSIFLLPDDVPCRRRPVCERETNFVVWMILLLPFIAVGDLYVVLKGLHSWVHCKMLIPFALRFALATHVFSIATDASTVRKPDMEIYRKVMRMLRIIAMAFGCWNLFAVHPRDEILLHPLPTLVMAASICDIVEFIIGLYS